MNIPLTPLRFLRHAERQYAGRTAIVSRGERFTYKQFGERSALLGGALRHAGIQPGERVAYLGTNSHRLLETYYGVLEAGAILLPLNIRLSAAELTFVLQDSGASVLLIDPQFVPLVDSFRLNLSSVRLFCQLEGDVKADWVLPHTYDQWIGAAEPYRGEIALVNEDAVAEIFYTSGTSAQPKGVMLTNRNIYLHALETAHGFSVANGSVELHTIPLFHANGWGIAHFLTMLGGKHVMVETFDPVAIFRYIETERVTQFNAVPFMATVLVNHPAIKDFDLSSLTRIVIGGAASSPTLIRQVEQAFGCACFSGYGLTETSPALTYSSMKPELARSEDERYVVQAMAGYAFPGVELRIADENDEFLPEDGVAVGELIARGDGIMKGYWNQPDLERRSSSRRLVSYRRHGQHRRPRLRPDRRSQEGHHRERWGKHLVARGGKGDAGASVRAGGRRDSGCGRALGRGPQGSRRAQARHNRVGSGVAGLQPIVPDALQVSQDRSFRRIAAENRHGKGAEEEPAGAV